MDTQRYLLNIINSLHGKEPVKENFNTFDVLSDIRSLWEDRIIESFYTFTLTENFQNQSDKYQILSVLYAVVFSVCVGLFVAFFTFSAASFNMSWCYNKALGHSNLETTYWALLSFIFFAIYFPYYGLILQPLCIKPKNSWTKTVEVYITWATSIGLPIWSFFFSKVF
jgi:hypothetical protein